MRVSGSAKNEKIWEYQLQLDAIFSGCLQHAHLLVGQQWGGLPRLPILLTYGIIITCLYSRRVVWVTTSFRKN
jgi:hypothetical protein